jgi:hypothetical protein
MPVHICLDSLTFVWIRSHLFGFVHICLDSLASNKILVFYDQYYYLVNSVANVDEA